MNRSRRPRLCLVLAFLVFLASCTTFQSVGPPVSAWKRLQPGEEVHVLTKDARDLQFVITAVDASSISGDGVNIPWSEIDRVESRRLDGDKTLDNSLKVSKIALTLTLGLAFIVGTLALL